MFGDALAAVLCVCLAGAKLPETAEASKFDIQTGRKDDRVVVSVQDEKTVLTVVSPFGIGKATIKCTAQRWPETLVLRLRLSGLESLVVGNARTQLAASVSSQGDGAVRLRLMTDGPEQPLDSSSQYWMDIRSYDAEGKPARPPLGKSGYFEMTIPKALLDDDSRTLEVRWIDFYRQ